MELHIGQLMAKRLHLMGSTLRDRSIHEKAQLVKAFADWGMGYLTDGTLTPNVYAIFDWEHVQMAHEMMRLNRNAGKIVLKVG